MRRWTALLLSLALLLVPGCQKEAERSSLPKLELHREEEKDYLLLEGVRYNRVSTDPVDNRYAGCWRFAGETGEAVASVEKMTLYTVAGDEEKAFLWGIQEGWAPGPFQQALFLREDRSLALPQSGEEFDLGTLSTYQGSGLFGKKPVVTWQSDDGEILTALFDAWDTGEETPLPKDREDRERRSLDLRSASCPWLAFRLECSRYEENGPIYFSDMGGRRTVIPEETAAALTWEEPSLWERLTG